MLGKITLAMVLLFGLGACVSPPYLKQNSAFIVFKTPTFKYADMGFVYENTKEVKVDIYGSGQVLMSLKILESLVCMSLLECMPKERFNAQVLSGAYPKNILDNILRGKKIFSGLGIRKKSNGFTQDIIKDGKYTIHYRVLNNAIIFRDTMNEILIKVNKQ